MSTERVVSRTKRMRGPREMTVSEKDFTYWKEEVIKLRSDYTHHEKDCGTRYQELKEGVKDSVDKSAENWKAIQVFRDESSKAIQAFRDDYQKDVKKFLVWGVLTAIGVLLTALGTIIQLVIMAAKMWMHSNGIS